MFEATHFRDALGRFATGVTIVTTRDAQGQPVGVTANSYNSVSLDPPLVLWSLAKTSRSMQAFQQSAHFAIHILACEQQELAHRFASRGEDKFAGVKAGAGVGEVPLLPECAAHFECETTYQYEGGDHVIFVGRVLNFAKSDKRPLIFHQGRFTRVREQDAAPEAGAGNNRYTDNFLPYLLSRAHVLVSSPVRKYCAELGIAEPHYATLGMLSMIGRASAAELMRRLAHTGQAPDAEIFRDLAARGWIESGPEQTWHLSATGREVFIAILSRSRAMEEDLLEGFDQDELAIGKRFLRTLIERSSADMPALFD
ncbi:flavin reductase [Caballeronia sp. AZ7_KS35]|uniref:flavin reductase n=1 Tax=Caballeronia sp. AZ7_KS35 TaxID=2921762 RepID=UPI0020277A93|nr:flavin reductase [Caballeronia sp. AZ7_KS35]